MTTPPNPGLSADANRRQSDRKALRVDAVVSLAGDQHFTVRTLDVSPGGLGIVAAANPRPGTGLVIQFALPLRPRGSLPVSIPARVIHSVFSSTEGGFKIGLAFKEVPPDVAQAIRRFMG